MTGAGVVGRGAENGAGVTEIGMRWSGEFCHSRSAQFLILDDNRAI